MSENKKIREEQRRARQKKKNRRKIKRVVFLVSEIIILLALCGAAYVMATYDKFQTVTFSEGDIQSNKGVKQEGYMTVALFGGDSRNGDLEKGAHTDTIILASIHHDTKEVRLASVYRDTLTVQVNGKVQKANYAYFAGGPKDAINVLNKNFDLDIQNYVTVDFKALADVIDLLGGIELEVTEQEAKEVNNYIDETGTVAEKKATHLTHGGTLKLDGVQAVTYARIRKNVGGDYKRAERQQKVIAKVVEKAKTMNIKTINKIIDKVFPKISTNFSLADMIGLAKEAFDYKLTETTGFPMEAMNGRVDKVGSVIIPVGLTENVQELHKFLYPKEKDKEVSDTVKSIEKKIEMLTGITRDKLNDPNTDISKSEHGVAGEEKK
ncbi:LCP family protein [Faecalimonas sp.]